MIPLSKSHQSSISQGKHFEGSCLWTQSEFLSWALRLALRVCSQEPSNKYEELRKATCKQNSEPGSWPSGAGGGGFPVGPSTVMAGDWPGSGSSGAPQKLY